MAGKPIDASRLAVFMTSTGHIALCSNQLNEAEEAEIFGSIGVNKPKRIFHLIEEMLSHLEASPDSDDADDLRILESELRASLTAVRKRIQTR